MVLSCLNIQAHSFFFYFYSHKNSLNLLGEKYLNESNWPMRRIRLLECNNNNRSNNNNNND